MRFMRKLNKTKEKQVNQKQKQAQNPKKQSENKGINTKPNPKHVLLCSETAKVPQRLKNNLPTKQETRKNKQFTKKQAQKRQSANLFKKLQVRKKQTQIRRKTARLAALVLAIESVVLKL